MLDIETARSGLVSTYALLRRTWYHQYHRKTPPAKAEGAKTSPGSSPPVALLVDHHGQFFTLGLPRRNQNLHCRAVLEH